LNSSFEVQSASGKRAWLVLTSVEDLNKTPTRDAAVLGAPAPQRFNATPRTDTFALHFYCAGDSLVQDTYTVSHATLGKFDLLIVPLGVSTYVAVFNRLVGPASRA
jgi:hypothetical protein